MLVFRPAGWEGGRCRPPHVATLCSLQVPCLCGGASCLLCSCCPNSKNSTLTRLIYAFILFLGTIVCCIMFHEGMETQLKKVSRSNSSLINVVVLIISCFAQILVVISIYVFTIVKLNQVQWIGWDRTFQF